MKWDWIDSKELLIVSEWNEQKVSMEQVRNGRIEQNTATTTTEREREEKNEICRREDWMRRLNATTFICIHLNHHHHHHFHGSGATDTWRDNENSIILHLTVSDYTHTIYPVGKSVNTLSFYTHSLYLLSSWVARILLTSSGIYGFWLLTLYTSSAISPFAFAYFLVHNPTENYLIISNSKAQARIIHLWNCEMPLFAQHSFQM